MAVLKLLSADMLSSRRFAAGSRTGFGYSEAPARPGFDVVSMAALLKNFMHRLGYEKFYVHGSGLGGIAAQIMATLYPGSIRGALYLLLQLPRPWLR
ncbi:hypothetical protein NQ318_017909 [Aromia moschata]|uniref:AB hydrolase-1 domain-containing protein n=1 Tax=Aromia moschata TaxID=1265417 RepID=A0AAV8YCT0_9CUCU|nr:hypothetical protein NQ318_017909 [Aromia moschata]